MKNDNIKSKTQQYDLFGKPIIKDVLLRDKFIEPPFSILDTKTGSWQRRKRQWGRLGIKSEMGRKTSLTHIMPMGNYNGKNMKEEYYEKGEEIGTSTFDPALTELMYHWFCPEGGKILDPFAGGSVRGIVAHHLGYKYTGIELRQEQVESNREQAKKILGENNQPIWYIGDSNRLLDNINEEYDFIFSCPPYMDLEVYSDLEGELSNMSYKEFFEAYRSIIVKSCEKLKKGNFACFVVGEVRNKKGYYIGFVPATIKAFLLAGMQYYNEIILLNVIGSASMRANRIFGSNKKVVKIHQNVLIFIKP